MELKEIIKNIPDLKPGFVHYLESQGFLSPRKIRKERISRRDYSKEDFYLIRAMWSYYQEGLSPRNAYRAAMKGMSKKVPHLASPFLQRGQLEEERIEHNKEEIGKRTVTLELTIPAKSLDTLLEMISTGKEGEINLRIRVRK